MKDNNNIVLYLGLRLPLSVAYTKPHYYLNDTFVRKNRRTLYEVYTESNLSGCY